MACVPKVSSSASLPSQFHCVSPRQYIIAPTKLSEAFFYRFGGECPAVSFAVALAKKSELRTFLKISKVFFWTDQQGIAGDKCRTCRPNRQFVMAIAVIRPGVPSSNRANRFSLSFWNNRRRVEE